MGSLERYDGFRKRADELHEQITRIKRTDSVHVKRDVLRELMDEYELYKGMYIAEMEIYTGLIKRGPKKYILDSDGFTFKLNPEWKAVQQKRFKNG
jgi:hypothetical protein